MPITQEKAVLKVVVEGSDQAVRLLRSFGLAAEKETGKAGNASVKNLARMASQFIGLAAGIRTAYKTITSGVDFNKFIEEQTTAFTVMLKSADAAKNKIAELYDFAVKSPLTFKETVSGSKQLLAYGFAAEELVPTMKTLGTVAKATGHSLDDISYVYGTLRAQGRAYTRDLMQFGMRGIPIYEELAAVMGVNQEELKKMTEQGKVGFREVEEAFKNMTSEGGRFAGLMDQYMKTLSGRLSMLTDIAQQASGALSKGIFDALSDNIPAIMDALDGSRDTLRVFGEELGVIAGALVNLVATLIKMLPLIITIGKIVLAGAFLKFILSLPALLATATAAVGAFTSSLAWMQVTMMSTSIASGVSSMVSSIGTLTRALIAFAANPAVLAILAIGAAIGVASSLAAKESTRRKDLMESDPGALLREDVYRSQLIGQYSGGQGDVPVAIPKGVSDIKKIAEQYKVSITEAATILKDMGHISASTLRQVQDSMDASELKREMSDLRKKKDRWEIEAEWLATFAQGDKGKKERYLGVNESYGGRAAIDYIALFEKDRTAMKEALGSVFSKDDLKDSLKEEAGELRQKLIEGAEVLDYTDPTVTFDDKLRARLKEIDILLEGLSSGAAESVKKVVKDIWYVREQQVKATDSQLDDLELARDKELAVAQSKYAQEEISYMAHWKAVQAIDIKYMKDIEKERKSVMEKMRTTIIEAYNTMLEGSSTFFDNLKIIVASLYKSRIPGTEGAAAGYQALSATQGTDTGALLTGGDPMAMFIQKMLEMIVAIENVNKVLNFIGTIVDASGLILIPLINSGFSGLASALEEIGVVVGQILAPIFNTLGVILQFTAGILKTTLIPILQLVGGAFAWLNDYVIVPFGNGVIDVLNVLIRGINAIFGTHIQILEHLKTTAEAFALSMETATDSLGATISYLEAKLNKLIDAQVKSAQEYLEVGAISVDEYQRLIDQANAMRPNEDELVSIADKQLTTLQEIYDRLQELYAQEKEGDNALVTYDPYSSIRDLGDLYPAGGGEVIDFGKITPKAGMSLNIYVAGSVTSERDLAKTISDQIYINKARGLTPAR